MKRFLKLIILKITTCSASQLSAICLGKKRSQSWKKRSPLWKKWSRWWKARQNRIWHVQVCDHSGKFARFYRECSGHTDTFSMHHILRWFCSNVSGVSNNCPTLYVHVF